MEGWPKTQFSSLRSLEGGIIKASRYLATVRLATLIFCSASNAAILLSDRGFRVFSLAIRFFISARIAVDETSPPECVLTCDEKKYLSSKMPMGVSMYFCVVTREMVDSCKPTASAMSCSTRGRMPWSPWSKKSFYPHNFCGNSKKRLIALLKAFNKPARLLHLFLEVGLIGAGVIPPD